MKEKRHFSIPSEAPPKPLRSQEQEQEQEQEHLTPPIQGGDGNYGVRTPGASVDPETGEITPFDNIVPLAGRG